MKRHTKDNISVHLHELHSWISVVGRVICIWEENTEINFKGIKCEDVDWI